MKLESKLKLKLNKPLLGSQRQQKQIESFVKPLIRVKVAALRRNRWMKVE